MTAPDCIVRWFCDEVHINDDVYEYGWNGDVEEAELIDDIEEERLRFKWLDADDDDEYLEFKMSRSEVTGQTVVEITDFCDEDEVADQQQLWTNQMESMRKAMGG